MQKAEYLEQKEQDKKSKDKDKPTLQEPKQVHLITNDITLESLAIALDVNPKGLLLSVDELAGWVKSFGKYSKGGAGSESKKWLSIWSNEYISQIRVSREDIFIDKSFVNVVGGIQNGILHELAKNGLDIDGFLYRFLFVFADRDKPQTWASMNKDASNATKEYYELIEKFIGLSMTEEKELKLASEAEKVWADWFDLNQVRIHEHKKSKEEEICSILSKMSVYCGRFALISELLLWSVGKSSLESVSMQSMEKAIILTEYFIKTSFLALNIIQENKEQEHTERNTHSSNINWLDVFGEDKELKRADIVDRVANKYGKSQRTIDGLIKSELKKVRYGVFSL